MTTDTDMPEWALTEIRYWIDVFNLEQWDITAGLDRIVNDNPHCMAWCERNASYNSAVLHFRTDIEDTPEWRKVILHEMTHIVMARVDAYVQEAVIPNLAESSHNFAAAAYTQHVESCVQLFTRSFWRYYRAQMAREHDREVTDATT